jgi:hypothetical protein
MRLEKAASVQTDETSAKLSDMKPGTKLSCEAFVQTVNQLATSTGKEAEMQAELLAMIDEVKRLGPPPPETGVMLLRAIPSRQYHHMYAGAGQHQQTPAAGAAMPQAASTFICC